MMYPLVLDLAEDAIPVAVTCRVLGFSKQAFYQWKAKPVSDRDYAHLINAAIDVHHDDPTHSGVTVDQIARLVGHTRGTNVTELIYRRQIRPVIDDGAAAIDRL